jgi:hypothetical protein
MELVRFVPVLCIVACVDSAPPVAPTTETIAPRATVTIVASVESPPVETPPPVPEKAPSAVIEEQTKGWTSVGPAKTSNDPKWTVAAKRGSCYELLVVADADVRYSSSIGLSVDTDPDVSGDVHGLTRRVHVGTLCTAVSGTLLVEGPSYNDAAWHAISWRAQLYERPTSRAELAALDTELAQRVRARTEENCTACMRDRLACQHHGVDGEEPPGTTCEGLFVRCLTAGHVAANVCRP